MRNLLASKWWIGLSLFLILLAAAFLLWTRLSPPPPPTAPLRTRDNIENLVIAVAPFSTNGSSASEGRKVQEKIILHMEKDLGLKTLKLSNPVSMGSSNQPDLAAGFDNAQKTLVQTGADLLVWGDEQDRGKEIGWNTYLTASVRAQCLAREQGFTLQGNADLDDLAEGDVLPVLDWVTASWRGLIERSEGMDISSDLRTMVPKIDAILGLAAEKHWDTQTFLTIKRNMAFLLCQYGISTKDILALHNAIRLSREVIAGAQVDPETHLPILDTESASTLGQSLFTLGDLETDPRDLEEAADVFQRAAKEQSRKYDPQDWAVFQTYLGAALAEVGKRQADPRNIHRALEAFEGALQETSKTGQPHQWLFVQTGLAACYHFLGARETDNTNLKKALEHYLLAETPDSKVLMPLDYATAEINIAGLYFNLGEREKSADDMRQAILHSQNAVEPFSQMGNNYNVGFALSTLGRSQLRLGQYLQDDLLLKSSQDSLKRSEELVPQSQDMELWCRNQLYLGVCQELMGGKKFDQVELQSASDIYGQLRSLYDPKVRKPMWDELSNFQAEAEVLLGTVACDSKREDGVIGMLGPIKSGLDPQKDALRAEQIDETLGKAMFHKGVKEKDPALLHQAIAILNEALDLTREGSLEQARCSCRSELAFAYSGLLDLGTDAEAVTQAKSLLEILEKDCETSPVPLSQAEHRLNTAHLERTLASLEKKKDRLIPARSYAMDALKILQEHGYTFYAAAAQLELGDEDLLLGQLTGDRSAYQKALKEYSDAQAVFQAYGDCWKEKLAQRIIEAKK